MADPSYTAVVSPVSGTPVIPFSTASTNAQAHQIQFVNPTGSAAFDFSLDGGKTWHLRPFSATLPYIETQNFTGFFNVLDVVIRTNGASAVTNLSVEVA